MSAALAEINLLALRSALMLRAHRGLRRASDELGVNASVLSRRIDALEAALGVALFQRTPSGTRATAAGERFLRDAEAALHLLEAAADRAASGAGDEGRLALGYVWPVCGSPAESLLRRFRSEQPGVELELRRGEARDLATALLEDRLDLAFLPMDEVCPGLARWPVWTESWLVARSTSPVATDSVLICAGRDDVARTVRLARGTRWADVAPRPLAATLDGVLSLVAAGAGVAFVPESIARTSGGDVRFAPLEPTTAPLQICAAWRPRPADRRLEGLLALVRGGAAESKAGHLRRAS